MHTKNGHDLPAPYRDKLYKSLSYQYFPASFLGMFMMIGSCYSAKMMTKEYLSDETMNSGLFQFAPVKIAVMVFSLLIIIIIFASGFKLFSSGRAYPTAIRTHKFSWERGVVTDKKRVRRMGNRKHTTHRIYIDGIECIPVDMNKEKFDAVRLGDPYIIIYIEKQSVIFAIEE